MSIQIDDNTQKIIIIVTTVVFLGILLAISKWAFTVGLIIAVGFAVFYYYKYHLKAQLVATEAEFKANSSFSLRM